MGDEEEEWPIVGETLPLVDMPLLRYTTGQPDPARLLWALVQSRNSENVGPVPTNEEPCCPWDYKPVTEWGDTCDLGCYEMWTMWKTQLDLPGNEKYRVVDADDVPPRSVEFQPWYKRLL